MPKNSYGYYEDNGGGLYLFIFSPSGRVVDGIGNLEYAQPGEWASVKDGLAKNARKEVKGWDGHLDNPQRVYDELTGYEFGWRLIASENGVYPERMGAAGRIYFGVVDA